MPWGHHPQPPANAPGQLESETVDAGTSLCRLYSDPFRITQFNPTPRIGLSGARFDCTPGDVFGVLYVGSEDGCAVAETLLRDSYGPAPHAVHPNAVQGRRLGCLTASRDLALVSLRGPGLFAVGPARQWLTTCAPRYYDATRGWGAAIRGWAPWADGFAWRARHDNNLLAYVLFEDRVPESALAVAAHPVLDPLGSDRVDSGSGLQYLKNVLARYQAFLGP